MKKILVIIPAFNEEQNIDSVIRKLEKESLISDIVIINDGSTDRTAEVAKKSGAKVVTLPANLGIGGAVQTGFIYAVKNGFDIALQVDGDGQHSASEIKKLVEPLLKDEADVTIGSRFVSKTSYKAPLERRLGIYLLSSILKGVTKKKFTDPTSGFRAYNQKAISLLATHYSVDYPEPDAIVTLVKNGLRVKELSVEMEARLHGKSSITPFKSIYYMIKVSLTIILNSLMERVWRE